MDLPNGPKRKSNNVESTIKGRPFGGKTEKYIRVTRVADEACWLLINDQIYSVSLLA